MKDSFKDIWNHELVLEATNASIAAENVPEGCSVIPQGIATLGNFFYRFNFLNILLLTIFLFVLCFFLNKILVVTNI